MIKKITFLLLTAMLLSCSNPLDKKYSEATLEQDTKELRESNKLTGEELELLGIWMVKSKLVGKSLEGKTYNDILSDAKNDKLEQEKLKKEAELAKQEKAKKMNEALRVSIIGTSFFEGEWNSFNVFEYAIKNKSQKTIDAVKFKFRIFNKLGDEIGDGYNVSVTKDKIAPDKIYTDEAGFDFNQFKNEDLTIKNSKFEDIKFVVDVEKVVYTDQSVLQ